MSVLNPDPVSRIPPPPAPCLCASVRDPSLPLSPLPHSLFPKILFIPFIPSKSFCLTALPPPSFPSFPSVQNSLASQPPLTLRDLRVLRGSISSLPLSPLPHSLLSQSRQERQEHFLILIVILILIPPPSPRRSRSYPFGFMNTPILTGGLSDVQMEPAGKVQNILEAQPAGNLSHRILRFNQQTAGLL